MGPQTTHMAADRSVPTDDGSADDGDRPENHWQARSRSASGEPCLDYLRHLRYLRTDRSCAPVFRRSEACRVRTWSFDPSKRGKGTLLMTLSARSVRLALLFLLLTAPTGRTSPPRAEPVTASIETTLTTNDAQVRQLAFDGDGDSFFASKEAPGADDHFTLVLDQPVRLRTIAATTGRADGSGRIQAGALEVSTDGTTFRELARFGGGTARGGPADRLVRIVAGPTGRAPHPVRRRPSGPENGEGSSACSRKVPGTFPRAKAVPRALCLSDRKAADVACVAPHLRPRRILARVSHQDIKGLDDLPRFQVGDVRFVAGLGVHVVHPVIRPPPPPVQHPQEAAGVVEIGVAARPQAMPQLAVPRWPLAELDPDGLQRFDSDIEGRVVGPADRAPDGF